MAQKGPRRIRHHRQDIPECVRGIVATPGIGPRCQAVSGILIVGLFVSCGPRPATVTVQSLDATRARWDARAVRKYHITVDVDRPGDRRRNDIRVFDETIISSSVSYWDETTRSWGPSRELTVEQATPFTVSGLFALIRQELIKGHRSDCRVAFAGDPPIPERILLGPVMRSEGPVSGTEATIAVAGFEPG